MATKKYLISLSILLIMVITAVILIINSSTPVIKLDDSKTFEDHLASDVEKYRQGNDNYSTFKQIDTPKRVVVIITYERYTEDGRNFHGAKFLTYERNNESEEFTLSRTGGLTTRKPYQELLDFVKNNNVFDYTDKQLSDMFGSASLESGYYLGQSLNSIKAGLPAVVWRHWSPNYKNLVYVYQTDNPKDLDGYRDRTFIEKGETDIALSDAVPYSYFPLFYDDFLNFDPIVFINDSEFYFIAQPNFGAEGKQTSVSKKLQNMSKEERDNLGFGVFVYNINTGSYRMIEELPVSTRKYKYITYDNGFYVYGGNLEVVKKYNSNGVFEKDIAYLNKDLEKDFAVINFTGWRGNNGKELDGKLYQIANFENTSVGDFVEGLMAPLEEIK